LIASSLYSIPQDIYDVNALDLMKLGKSFGFSEPPHVPLDLTGTKRKKVKMDKAHKRFAFFKCAGLLIADSQ